VCEGKVCVSNFDWHVKVCTARCRKSVREKLIFQWGMGWTPVKVTDPQNYVQNIKHISVKCLSSILSIHTHIHTYTKVSTHTHTHIWWTQLDSGHWERNWMRSGGTKQKFQILNFLSQQTHQSQHSTKRYRRMCFLPLPSGHVRARTSWRESFFYKHFLVSWHTHTHSMLMTCTSIKH
jgi:hypothetical protein